MIGLNEELGTAPLVLPGTLAATVDGDWLDCQRAAIEEASSRGCDQLIVTVALSEDAVRDQEQIHELLEASADWRVAGWYLVCEHPHGEYLVTDPNWLANVLDLVAGSRIRQGTVIVGYCTHQMLIAAAAGATAIASGTWMNVRSFPPEKFLANYEDEIKQRAVWYYCAQALSEYKLPFLDIAYRQGVLGEMAPNPALASDYAIPLFEGIQPSTIGLTEQAAFRHYLQCLRAQIAVASRTTFDETAQAHRALLDDAEGLLARLRTTGLSGQLRDFRDSLDVNRSALTVLEATRGPVLRHCWPNR